MRFPVGTLLKWDDDQACTHFVRGQFCIVIDIETNVSWTTSTFIKALFSDGQRRVYHKYDLLFALGIGTLSIVSEGIE